MVGGRIVAAVTAIVGMIALPALCLTLRNIGPASRVVFYPYLPFEELAIVLSAAVIGAWLGAQVPRWVRPNSPPQAAASSWPKLRWIAFGLLMGWVAQVQVCAFPAAASVNERSAWAKANVPQFAALSRVVAALPEVQRDIGTVVAIAPTAADEHRSAREMNGDDMLFVLDVVGDRGAGVFHADCTLDEYRVYDWRAGRWLSQGRELRIERVPELVPR